MLRYLLVLCVLCVALFAFGEKPKALDTTTDTAAAIVVENTYEQTADAQYERILRDVQTADQSKLKKHADAALISVRHFEKQYAQDARRVDMYFIATILNELKADYAAADLAIAQYMAQAASENRYYVRAQFAQARSLIRAEQFVTAQVQIEAVVAQHPTDNALIAIAYTDILPVYEATNNTVGLKKVYSFFIEHRMFLQNPDLYYVYAYKLGVIYYNAEDYDAAQKYFTITKTVTAPALQYLKQSIDGQYKLVKKEKK